MLRVFWVGLSIVMGSAFGQNPGERQEAERWLRAAEQAEHEEDYIQALACLSRVIVLDPGRQESYLKRAQIKEKTAAWMDALVDYNIYLEWNPDHFEVRWLRAMLQLRMKKWTAAQADLFRLLRVPPGETTHVIFEVNPYHQGLQRMFTAHSGNKPEIYNAMGLTFLETGEHEKALIYLDSALRLHPNYAEALANRGLVKAQLQQTTAARADMTQAIALQPDLEVARHNLAVTYHSSSAEEEAYLSQLIAREPAIPFPYYDRAIIRIEQKNYTAALADLSKALQIDSLNEIYWIARGTLFEKMARWQEALADHGKAIRLNANRAEAWFHHGNAAHKMNDRRTAIEDYTMALFLNENYGNAWYNRAIMYHESGQPAKACEDLLHAGVLGVGIDLRLKKKVCP